MESGLTFDEALSRKLAFKKNSAFLAENQEDSMREDEN